MFLSQLVDLVLWQVTQMIPLPLVTLDILTTTEEPHAARGNDTSDLEGNAGGNAGHVVRAVALWEDDGRDDAADLAAGDGKGGSCAALDIADDLVCSRRKEDLVSVVFLYREGIGRDKVSMVKGYHGEIPLEGGEEKGWVRQGKLTTTQ